ncbi:MAG: FmdB family zinc ribbon protein [Rhodoferax sp.]
MPIYAYKCESCGFAKDVLQKMSDPLLTDCPSCGASAFKKQLTAAGFQLKGSGWYATDFKGGTSAPAPASPTAPGAETASKGAEVGAKPSESSAPKTESTPPAASGGCGGPCACH